MIVRSRCVVAILLVVNPLLAWVMVQPPARFLPSQRRPPPATTMVRCTRRSSTLGSSSSAADIEQPSLDEGPTVSSGDSGTTKKPTQTIRSKINEIDYCIDPADVSLNPVRNSMTYALNDASNRVVRRILLARSWPTPEALNRSLMQYQVSKKKKQQLQEQGQSTSASGKEAINDDEKSATTTTTTTSSSTKKSPRSDTEYVADQLQAFAEKYGTLENYPYACEYLEVILALATRGMEPPDQVANLYRHKIYDEAYRRVLSVLKTVGVSFLVVKATPAAELLLPSSSSSSTVTENTKQRVLAPKLKDLDICLSVMDKLRMQRQQPPPTNVLLPDNDDAQQPLLIEPSSPAKDKEKKKKTPLLQRLFGGRSSNNKNGAAIDDDAPDGILLSRDDPSVTVQLNTVSNIVLRALLFGGDEELLVIVGTLESDRDGFIQMWWPDATATTTKTNRPALDYLDALIALLRSCYDDRVITSLEPKVQLSNSYGTAYERLVATAVELGSGYFRPETLFGSSTSSDSNSNSSSSSINENSLESSLPRPRNPREELGRFAQWESQFRQGASSATDMELLRPNDLVGTWQVQDVVGGQTIGVTNVTFVENGLVQVAEPLVGRQWRLDPGPTHLDTCQFQVMTPDGNLLNYRGFIDRGARLEARFSGRPLRIRGSVMFQMRDGAATGVGSNAAANSYYYKEYIIPINYRSGTTKFVMTKTKNSAVR